MFVTKLRHALLQVGDGVEVSARAKSFDVEHHKGIAFHVELEIVRTLWLGPAAF